MKPITAKGETKTISKTEQLVGCPKCSAQLRLQRSSVPLMDSCGFEGYSLECDQCGAKLVAIIDPLDDQSLLSELES